MFDDDSKLWGLELEYYSWNLIKGWLGSFTKMFEQADSIHGIDCHFSCLKIVIWRISMTTYFSDTSSWFASEKSLQTSDQSRKLQIKLQCWKIQTCSERFNLWTFTAKVMPLLQRSLRGIISYMVISDIVHQFRWDKCLMQWLRCFEVIENSVSARLMLELIFLCLSCLMSVSFMF